ncbi:MAG: hypothetical protein EHM67_10500 [Hyphomicrobiaceae bacterium]|nr:MAG: hypothetical protein EHM67_10500 [Hyphomicrobiaceae bacterium]
MIDIETQLRSYQHATNIRGATREMCGRAADEIKQLRMTLTEIASQCHNLPHVENYRRIRVRIMMDIAEQLREYAHHWHKGECPTRKGNYCTCGYEGEAGLRFLRGAEEIERLREALKRKQETR